MGLGLNKYEITIQNQRSIDGHSNDGLVSSGVLVVIHDAGTSTQSTIYSNGTAPLAAKTNPISRSQFATDGKIEFYSYAESHDIFIADNRGNTCKYFAVTPNVHTLGLNTDGPSKLLVIPFGVSDNTEVDTGIDLPADVVVTECWTEVTTNDTGETLAVGLLSTESGGDADGLLASVDVGTAGYVKPYVITAGTTETYVSTTYYGAMMGPVTAGSNSALDFGIAKGFGHFSNSVTAKSISYTGSSGSDTAAGLIYVRFEHLK